MKVVNLFSVFIVFTYEAIKSKSEKNMYSHLEIKLNIPHARKASLERLK